MKQNLRFDALTKEQRSVCFQILGVVLARSEDALNGLDLPPWHALDAVVQGIEDDLRSAQRGDG